MKRKLPTSTQMRNISSYFQHPNMSSSRPTRGWVAYSQSIRDPSQRLINFYAGTGKDDEGRTLKQILEWDDVDLELQHDFIQTLFPIPEHSRFVNSALLVTREVLEAFRDREELRENLFTAFQKMLWFYGLEHRVNDDGGIEIVKSSRFKLRAKQSFNMSSDHNHARISRIIRSLRLLQHQDEALAFYKTLIEVGDRVGDSSREFWRRAAYRSLNIAPSATVADEHDETIGEPFLVKWVQDEKKRLSEQALSAKVSEQDDEP